MKKLIFALALLFLAVSCPASAQQPFPARGVEIVNGLYKGVNPQDDNARRERIKVTCEQMRFELGARWGGKRRAPNGPTSPDSLAYNEPDNTISIWDIQTSNGDITVYENKPPDYPNDSPANSAFIVCEAIDHLGAVPPPPVEPVPPPQPDLTPTLARLLAEVEAAAANVERVRQSLEEHRAEVRKERNRVVAFLSNWRNYAKIGTAVIGTIMTQRAMDGAQ